MKKDLVDELIELSLSMFRKNFFGIFHGSLSAKLEGERFVINTKDAIFDELTKDDFITIYYKEDYRYKTASIDSYIHRQIYQDITDAKYICYAMPHNIISYSLAHDVFHPKDYFASQRYPELKIYDPQEFKNWYNRAPEEISNYLKNTHDVMIIRGYGIFTYSRDLKELVKKIAIVENSAKLLINSSRY